MAIKCSNCGFTNNPDNAHYCGKCGKKVGSWWEDWKLYEGYFNTVISKNKLAEYKRYEAEAKAPFYSKLIKLCKQPFDKIIQWWKTDGSDWFWGISGCIIIVVAFFVIFQDILKSCSHKISRIEVNGKYGIGYSKDELLVKAEYDSISSSADGNYWVLFDKTNDLKGLAYVKDETVKIIEPKYKNVYTGAGHYAFLTLTTSENIPEFLVYDGVLFNEEPYLSLRCTGSLDNPSLFVASKGYQQKFLIKPNLTTLPETFKKVVECTTDSVIVATLANGWPSQSILYDLKGNRLNNTDLYEVDYFSEGVTWGFASVTDCKNNIWSLFDRQGNNIFTFTGKKYQSPFSFSDGVSWIRRYGQNKWSAIDKTGKELFNIEAYLVHPFTMGVAPVYKGSYRDKKMGFVNKQGETVIPFKYVAKDVNPKFDSDSLIEVKLDGVEGKLHRNGKFTPNSQTK